LSRFGWILILLQQGRVALSFVAYHRQLKLIRTPFWSIVSIYDLSSGWSIDFAVPSATKVWSTNLPQSCSFSVTNCYLLLRIKKSFLDILAH